MTFLTHSIICMYLGLNKINEPPKLKLEFKLWLYLCLLFCLWLSIPEIEGNCSKCLVAVGWWLVAGGWWLVASGWWLVAGGWWKVAGGWWLVAGGWWLVAVG